MQHCLLLVCCLLASSCFLSASLSMNGDLPSIINSALKLHQGGQLSAAIQGYTQALDIIDSSQNVSGKLASTLASNLGAIYMSREQYEQSKRYFEKAVTYDSESSSASYNLAVLLTSKMNSHSEALRYAILALKLDPSNHKALHICGNIMQALGRDDDANRYFVKAEQLALQAAGGVAASSAKATAPPAFVDRLRSAAVDDVMHVDGFNESKIEIRCLSERPLIFGIANLLSEEDCGHIVARASSSLERSFTMGGDSNDKSYRSSSSTWLPHSTDPVLQRLLCDLSAITSLPLRYLQQRSEELQVVRYDSRGEFKMHHDSSGFHKRLLTLLVYLTDVPEGGGGETYFPFALHGGASPASVEEAVESSGELAAGSTGLSVRPRKGHAILFFNHLLADGYHIDPTAVHAGLPVQEGFGKAVANFWIELDAASLAE